MAGYIANLRPFQHYLSHQGDGNLIIKGCVQWNSVHGGEKFRLERGSNWSARSVGQRLAH